MLSFDPSATPDVMGKARSIHLTHQSGVLLTGASGMIGGALAQQIDRFGVKNLWCLIREKNGATAEKRLRARMLKSASNSYMAKGVAGDVTLPLLGLNPENVDEISSEVDLIIHSAAETSFISEENCHAINVEGTAQLINFAKRCVRQPLIIFVSTACNGGKHQHAVLDEDQGCRPDRDHHNVYTRSKAISESLIRHSGLPYLIVRPTIVFSDGIEDPVFARQILWFAPLLREFSHLPINPEARLDVTPVSFVARAILALAQKKRRFFDTYHISAGTSYATTSGEIMNACCAFYGYKNLMYIQPNEWTPAKRRTLIATPLQRKIYYALRYYFPFFNSDIVYDHGRLASEVGPLDMPSLSSYMPSVLRQITWEDALEGSRNP